MQGDEPGVQLKIHECAVKRPSGWVVDPATGRCSHANRLMLENLADVTKKQFQEEYNTISFVGGHSVMDNEWLVQAKSAKKTKSFGGEDSNRAWGGVYAEGRVPFIGFGGHVSTEHSGGRKDIRLVSQVTTASDDSYSGFHLEDPDYGDYFVVQVFNDPMYNTPLFYLNGGASSCHWEIGTAHRSAPTLQWKYIGPNEIAQDMPAIFRLTLGNSLSYYEQGMRTDVDRPHWQLSEIGYVPPALSLVLMKKSIIDGLAVKANGWPLTGANLIFLEFGKGSIDVLAEIFRGPLAYVYPSPVFGWKDTCGGVGLDASGGENKYGHTRIDEATNEPHYALSMDVARGQARGIRYLKPCSSVMWSGAVQRDQGFVVNHGSTAVVRFAIANPSPATWDSDDRLQNLVFQYRVAGCVGNACWKDGTMALPHAGVSDISFEWMAPAFDADYDARVVTRCEFSSNPLHDTSSTAIVTGTVDRSAPVIVATHGDESEGQQIVLTATFSEKIVCSQTFECKFVFTAGTVLSTTRGQLTAVCAGNAVVISAARRAVPGNTFNLIITGVHDKVGNVANEVNSPMTVDRSRLVLDAMANTLTGVARTLADAAKQAGDNAVAALRNATERAKKAGDAVTALRNALADAEKAKAAAVEAKGQVLAAIKAAEDKVALSKQIQNAASAQAAHAASKEHVNGTGRHARNHDKAAIEAADEAYTKARDQVERDQAVLSDKRALEETSSQALLEQDAAILARTEDLNVATAELDQANAAVMTATAEAVAIAQAPEASVRIEATDDASSGTTDVSNTTILSVVVVIGLLNTILALAAMAKSFKKTGTSLADMTRSFNETGTSLQGNDVSPTRGNARPLGPSRVKNLSVMSSGTCIMRWMKCLGVYFCALFPESYYNYNCTHTHTRCRFRGFCLRRACSSCRAPILLQAPHACVK